MATNARLQQTALTFTNGGALAASATAASGTLTFSTAAAGGKVQLKSVADPSIATDAATKQYVDSVATGLKPKTAVKFATTGNGALATAFAEGESIDGADTLTAGDRILIKDQSTPAENGIYIVQATGAPVRATGAQGLAAGDNAAGAYVFVTNGTSNENKGFVCTAEGASDTVGTDDLTFTVFQTAAGGGGGDITSVTTNTTTSGLAGGTSSGDADLSVVVDTGTMQINGSNEVGVKASGIGTTQIANNAVTADKIVDTLTRGSDSTTTFHTDNATTFKANSGTAVNVIQVQDHDAATVKFAVTRSGVVNGNEFIADSDRRLKQNIVPIPTSAALATVAAMGPYSYEFKDRPGDQRCGVIAQELAEIAPELVKTTQKGTLAVDYNDMNAYLIGAIQALKQQVEEQADVIQRLSQSIPVAAL